MTEHQKGNVNCARCGALIGTEKLIGDLHVLTVGSIRMDIMAGVCTCGAQFYWSLNQKKLDRLIEGIINRETKIK